MPQIPTNFSKGGRGLTARGSSTDPSLKEILDGIATDLGELFTNFDALLAKLDADAGVTDADYAATLAVGDPSTTSE